MASLLDKIRTPRTPAKKAATGVAAGTAPKAAKVAKKAAPAPSAAVRKEDTKEAYHVLVRPLVTEKAARLSEHRQYVFAIAMDATRVGVARAVFALYGVRPTSVNISRVKGKYVRVARRIGKRKDWKKAIVTLAPGQSISIYQGV